jgi:diguanylate cyclase (GGDEF)-like protein
VRTFLLASRDGELLRAASTFSRAAGEEIDVRPCQIERLRSGEIPEFSLAVVDCREGDVDAELVANLARRRVGTSLPIVLIGSSLTDRDTPISVVSLPADVSSGALFAVLRLASEWGARTEEIRFLRKEVGLLRTLHGLFGSVDLDVVHTRIIEAMTDLLGVPFGYLLIWDDTRCRYVRRFAGEPRHRDGSTYIPVLSKEEVDAFLDSGETHKVVERSWLDPGGAPHRSLFLLVPIRSRLRRLGLAKFPLTEGEAALIDPHRLEAGSHLLGEIAAVVDNLLFLAETRELTIRDDLTKAYNRRYFESFVDEEIERARRYSGRFSLIFLDLDDLKSVNNLHGHLIGSRVLQEVGKRIIAAVRGVDKVARFGGDEFCVILPQTDEERAERVAERIREAISAEPYRLGPGIDVAMTASFGIATYPVHATTKDELVRASDRAMYEVKAARKNSVRVAGPREESDGRARPERPGRSSDEEGGDDGRKAGND